MIRGHVADSRVHAIGGQDWGAIWRPILKAPPPAFGGVGVVDVDGTLEGFAWFEPSQEDDLGGDTCATLRRLYVSPCAQGRGMGSALLAWAEDAARVAGALELVLWVLEANTDARDFYLARGLKPDGRTAIHRYYGLTKLRFHKTLLPGRD